MRHSAIFLVSACFLFSSLSYEHMLITHTSIPPSVMSMALWVACSTQKYRTLLSQGCHARI